ncbi:Protein CBG04282 [Caenorhabditis briggsae]|uniref:Uncharacterized protein n=2 Tax=Caenorhabditis briggsae TaxID=6238 RepID=A0AAE9DJF7_CAEBR|nr:Protein CBG04282 [Caenorhabditis briggsae]ULU04835.1 hypothetical protein L3Y34_017528 [Caenorhabditis briggsae]CAP25023.1 Protein CBG04282 [Caenorhabditis briggsae]
MNDKYPRTQTPRVYGKQDQLFGRRRLEPILQISSPKTESPTGRIAHWFPENPDLLSPPPRVNTWSSVSNDLESHKKEYNSTFTQAQYSENSSNLPTSMNSPYEMKLDEVKDELEKIDVNSKNAEDEKSRIEKIREDWKAKEMTDPENWPKLKLKENYDEDPLYQTKQSEVEGDLKRFRHSKMTTKTSDEQCSEEEEDLEEEDEEDVEAERVIQENSSEDNRFEASELIEYKCHDWCIALRIDRQKMENGDYQLLVYSYKRGIERLIVSIQQIDSLGTSLLFKYRYRADNQSIDVVQIYSALPSTGLVSLKYRTNKSIELRIYGLVNFVDFEKDPGQFSHSTMIWTDVIGPIYLTPAERTNIRRKSQYSEKNLFAPLRMCQFTVKSDFSNSLPNGSMIKWNVTAYTALQEEVQKDGIGRNFWPARIIRMDDLVVKMKILAREVNTKEMQHKYLQNNTNGGTTLTSQSNRDLRVFCGPHLTGILNSAGPKYFQEGTMMAFVVPYYQNREFAYFEALIAGPPRVVMIITEGRYLSYTPKTWPSRVQTMREKYNKICETKPIVRPLPTSMKLDEYRQKYRLGFKEFNFDFQ